MRMTSSEGGIREIWNHQREGLFIFKMHRHEGMMLQRGPSHMYDPHLYSVGGWAASLWMSMKAN